MTEVRTWGLFIGAAYAFLCACAGGEDVTPAAAAASAEPVAAPVLEAEVDNGPEPTAILPDGARLFGTALTHRAPVALSDISAHPETYADQVVVTSGTIASVCQAMGCWMELRAEGVEPVRIPMAGHSYFLPRNVAGRPAEIEGRVVLAALSDDARRHLEGEGATATSGTLSIEATGVVIR